MPVLAVFWFRNNFNRQHPLTAEHICLSLNFVISQRCWRITTLFLKCLRQILWLLVQVRHYIDWGVSEWENKDVADTEFRDNPSAVFKLVPGCAGPWCSLHRGCVLLWKLLLLKWSDFGVADGTAEFSDPSLFLGWCPYGSCVWLGSSEMPDNNYL